MYPKAQSYLALMRNILNENDTQINTISEFISTPITIFEDLNTNLHKLKLKDNKLSILKKNNYNFSDNIESLNILEDFYEFGGSFDNHDYSTLIENKNS